jgi:Na+/melibiose symporter-like transporter
VSGHSGRTPAKVAAAQCAQHGVVETTAIKSMNTRPATTGNTSMTRNPQERRTPEQIRAGNLRLGLILLAVVAVFFLGAVVKQVYFGGLAH